jgi:hypothetical protein
VNRASIVTTRAGIHIGSAYVPPPAVMSDDAEHFQRLLLTQRLERRAHAALAFLVHASVFCAVIVAAVVVWRL